MNYKNTKNKVYDQFGQLLNYLHGRFQTFLFVHGLDEIVHHVLRNVVVNFGGVERIVYLQQLLGTYLFTGAVPHCKRVPVAKYTSSNSCIYVLYVNGVDLFRKSNVIL